MNEQQTGSRWNYELHEDHYVLNHGDVQVGILFPDTGMPVGYIRHFVATLNAYYPTEPGTRWPCGKPEGSARDRIAKALALEYYRGEYQMREYAEERAQECTRRFWNHWITDADALLSNK